MNKNSGILLVDKPAQLTSAAVVGKIKKKFKLKKVGHGGTLDPFATGLMVILIGEATKVSRFFLGGEKSYLAEAFVGQETDSGDTEGEINSEKFPVPKIEAWNQTKEKFLGDIEQVPPDYSAVKLNGRPLYAYAREGISVQVPAKKISIQELNVQKLEAEKLEFSVSCSGGTYIRRLVMDWARKTKTRAYLTQLRRTRSSSFRIEAAHRLDQLLEREQLPELISIHKALPEIPCLLCPQQTARFIKTGNKKRVQDFLHLEADKIDKYENALLLNQGSVLALITKDNTSFSGYKLERVFH